MEKVAEALKSRNINAHIVSTKEEARQKALSLIDPKEKVNFGGSITLKDTGLLEELRKKDYKLIDRDLLNSSFYMKQWVMKNSAAEGVYLSGANAITEEGMIVNMDGWGNRINAINYGPDKVIIIAGKNKIVNNLDSAIERIKKVAGPMNTKRLKKNTPCAKTGECSDCRSDERICNILSVVQFQNNPDRIHVILVEENLGY